MQLAVALAHDADLLILDEPTSGLDPASRRDLLDKVADFMVDEPHAVVFSTHITSDLERIADYVSVLDSGRLVAHTTRDELLEGFRSVRGASGTLDAPTRSLVRGLREHAHGWDGLMATEDTVGLSAGVVVEAPSLEDVVVSYAQREPSHV
ncbi:ATP-binding cassette domain-containing protein [Nigerium massiliense]|uniref:hypothetical protein n=1 Tax=Nigerium massiliense TaxID=1522317 RepID=UPI002E231F76